MRVAAPRVATRHRPPALTSPRGPHQAPHSRRQHPAAAARTGKGTGRKRKDSPPPSFPREPEARGGCSAALPGGWPEVASAWRRLAQGEGRGGAAGAPRGGGGGRLRGGGMKGGAAGGCRTGRSGAGACCAVPCCAVLCGGEAGGARVRSAAAPRSPPGGCAVLCCALAQGSAALSFPRIGLPFFLRRYVCYKSHVRPRVCSRC